MDKRWAIAIIAMGSLSSLAIIAGTAYVVFGLGFSGWWWLFTVLMLQGECVSTYKLVNAVLFGTPAVTCGQSE